MLQKYKLIVIYSAAILLFVFTFITAKFIILGVKFDNTNYLAVISSLIAAVFMIYVIIKFSEKENNNSN
ncbi:MAG: 4-hydroxybenzoate polyprenyltransferase [Flavobacterium sp.]|jgi:4-hydroxybenzoate polyprenyltransferase